MAALTRFNFQAIMNRAENAPFSLDEDGKKPFFQFVFRCKKCRGIHTSFQANLPPHVYRAMVDALKATNDQDLGQMMLSSEGTRMHLLLPDHDVFQCPKCREVADEHWNEYIQAGNQDVKSRQVRTGEMAHVLQRLGGITLRDYVTRNAETYDALITKHGWCLAELASHANVAKTLCNRMATYREGWVSVPSFPQAIFDEMKYMEEGHRGVMYRGIKSCDPFKPLSLSDVKGIYGSNWKPRVCAKVAPWISAERALFATFYHVNPADGLHEEGRHNGIFTKSDAAHAVPRIRYLTNAYGLTPIRHRLLAYLVFPNAASRDYLRQVLAMPVATKRAREESSESESSGSETELDE
jgi:hypothetical protein